MSTRQELEAALAVSLEASFDRNQLAVYADLLQRDGDPRGELIALDLVERTPAIVARRAQLIAELAGPALRRMGSVEVELGFVDLVLSGSRPDEGLPDLLASPLGPYLRSVRMSGAAEYVRKNVGALARGQHVWLTTLRIQLDDSYGSQAKGPVISKRMSQQLVAATPRLVVLQVRSWRLGNRAGRPLFADDFTHPRAALVNV